MDPVIQQTADITAGQQPPASKGVAAWGWAHGSSQQFELTFKFKPSCVVNLLSL